MPLRQEGGGERVAKEKDTEGRTQMMGLATRTADRSHRWWNFPLPDPVIRRGRCDFPHRVGMTEGERSLAETTQSVGPWAGPVSRDQPACAGTGCQPEVHSHQQHPQPPRPPASFHPVGPLPATERGQNKTPSPRCFLTLLFHLQDPFYVPLELLHLTAESQATF